MAAFEVVFPGNKRVDVNFLDFTVKTDQLKKNQGEETAPEPFDIFVSSLAACAGIYAKSFCDARKLDTGGMTLLLDPFFKTGQKRLERIEMTLQVNPAFPEKYIKPVIKAMDGCAVKNQLHPDIHTQTRVVYRKD